jgi:hypothetical protein
MPYDPANLTSPERCPADFTYSITPTKLIIHDTGKGQKSVVEDLPAVLKKIEYWHQSSVERFELVVLGADGKRSSSSPITPPIAGSVFRESASSDA